MSKSILISIVVGGIAAILLVALFVVKGKVCGGVQSVRCDLSTTRPSATGKCVPIVQCDPKTTILQNDVCVPVMLEVPQKRNPNSADGAVIISTTLTALTLIAGAAFLLPNKDGTPTPPLLRGPEDVLKEETNIDRSKHGTFEEFYSKVGVGEGEGFSPSAMSDMEAEKEKSALQKEAKAEHLAMLNSLIDSWKRSGDVESLDRILKEDVG